MCVAGLGVAGDSSREKENRTVLFAPSLSGSMSLCRTGGTKLIEGSFL